MVEIVIDLEAEFYIKVPTDFVITGRVYEIVDLVKSLYSRQYIENLIALIPNDGPNGYIDSEQYDNLHKYHSSLPLPYNILKMRHKYKYDHIIGILKDKLKYLNYNLMEEKVYAIIKERSGFTGEVRADHHLVDDLKCG